MYLVEVIFLQTQPQIEKVLAFLIIDILLYINEEQNMALYNWIGI